MRLLGITITGMNFVIVGGGAMGLVHAASLATTSGVALLVRQPKQAEALNSAGTTVVDSEGMATTHPISASVDPAMLDHADVVVVAVKSYQTDDVAQLLKRSTNRTSMVLSIQSGLSHNDVLAEACGDERILLAKTGYAGKRIDETTVQLADRGTTVFGERDCSMSDRVSLLAGVLAETNLDAEPSTEMWSVLWSKFAQACCQNALSAITGLTFSQLLARPSAVELLQALSEEMKALANAEGVNLQFDPYERLLKNWDGLHHRSSMLQDMEAGRRTEVDALNGEAVRRGELAGVAMPANRSLWLLTKAMERT